MVIKDINGIIESRCRGLFPETAIESRAAKSICVMIGWNFEGQFKRPNLKKAICGANIIGRLVTS